MLNKWIFPSQFLRSICDDIIIIYSKFLQVMFKTKI